MTMIDSVWVDGGAERLAVGVTTRLDRDRFEPMVCMTRSYGDSPPDLIARGLEPLRAAGIPVMTLERRGKLDLRPWRGLVSTLRQRRVGVLHSHKFGSNVWASIVGPLAGVPAVVAHEHTWAFTGQPVRRLIDRHVIARRADVVIAVSEADRRRMIEIEGIPPERIRYIPNGVAATGAGPDARSRIRAELGIPADAPVVGAVGALREQKAYDVLLDAAAELRQRHPDVRVVVVGTGPELGTLRERVTEPDLAGAVTLLGARTDVPDVLTAFDVFVNSSDFEGQPLSLLEAMEAALPIVATRVGGVPDLVHEGVHALLVAPRDPHAIATAVSGLLSEPGEAGAMGERARTRRREEFDLDVTVRRIEALYDELLASRRDTASTAGPSASKSHMSLE